MYCKQCDELMIKVSRFEHGKSYQLYRCPVCYAESKQRPLNVEFDDPMEINPGKSKRKRK